MFELSLALFHLETLEANSVDSEELSLPSSISVQVNSSQSLSACRTLQYGVLQSSVSTIAPPMPATVSKPIPRLFSVKLYFFADPTHSSCGWYCEYKSIPHFFSISPPVAVNTLYFLVHAIDSLGGGLL